MNRPHKGYSAKVYGEAEETVEEKLAFYVEFSNKWFNKVGDLKDDIKQLEDENKELRADLLQTEKLSIAMCKTCLVNEKNPDTIDLLKKTIKELSINHEEKNSIKTQTNS